MSKYAFEGVARSGTTVTWSFAEQTYASDAQFPFSEPIASAYRATVAAAFAQWSAVSGLSFVQVPDSAAAAIRVGFGLFSATDEVGETDYRSLGTTLAADTVIRFLDPAADPLTQDGTGTWLYAPGDVSLYQVALHEIGHAIGLDHSTDPTTIMYPVATAQNRSLAQGDIWGANALYPLFTVAALSPAKPEGDSGLTPFSFSVTRYGDPSQPLTVDYAVSGTASTGLAGTVAATAQAFAGGGLPSGQLSFAAGSSTAMVTVNVAGNTVPSPDLGFALTITSTASGTAATTRGSNTATILDDDGFSALPAGEASVYRFFDQADGTHFYTASEAERNAVIQTRPDLAYEGPLLTALTDASNPQAAPVYRFFDTRFGTHFYTADSAERDQVAATRPDLVYEGAAFEDYAGPAAGAIPVYRFFDASNGTHFYTESATEIAEIGSTRPDLVSEGIAFYAPAA